MDVTSIIGATCTVEYINHKKETAARFIQIHDVYYGTTEYYPKPQLLLAVVDLDKNVERVFSLNNVTRWIIVSPKK